MDLPSDRTGKARRFPVNRVMALGLVLIVACGTTVPVSEQRRLLGQEGTGLDVAAPEAQVEPPADGQIATGGAGTQAAGRQVIRGAGGVPVVTETEVKVGIVYLEDAGTANAAAGFVGIGQVKQKRAYDAVIADINRTPIAGRKIVGVFKKYTTDEIRAKGPDRITQETCAYFTHEKPVFTFWGSGDDQLRACFTKGNVPMVGGGVGNSYSKTFEDYPYLVEFSGVAQDRMTRFYVEQLHARNYFGVFRDDVGSPPHPTNQPKIGLVRYNWAAHKAGAAVLKDALADRGLSLCQGCEFEIVRGETEQEALAEANQVNAAVDNCNSKGCTHILIQDSIAGVRLTIFWIQRSEQQVYRPRLGLTSLSAPAIVSNFVGPAVSRGAFGKSMVVGWRPLSDTFLETEEVKRCKKILTDAGETFGDPSDTSRNKDAQATAYCDVAWYYKAMVGAGGVSQGLRSFLNGVANVGRVPLSGVFLSETTSTRRDGVGAIRIAEYFEDCNCFRYVSDLNPV